MERKGESYGMAALSVAASKDRNRSVAANEDNNRFHNQNQCCKEETVII